jgi:acyl-coenzyme A thioesterase PaaI-like protein
MKKIVNPFAGHKGYFCFACCPDNQYGLKMTFTEEGDEVVCRWNPVNHLQGYTNVLHGGIQATMLDEIASWLVYVKLKTAGVTSSMTTKYRAPVYLDQGEITIRARLKEQTPRIAEIQTFLYNSAGKLCTEALVSYFIFPKKIAKEKYWYPGVDAFYEKEE